MFERYWKNISFLRCNKERLVLFNVLFYNILFSSSVEAFTKINEIPLRKKLRGNVSTRIRISRGGGGGYALAGTTFSRDGIS